MWLVIQQRQPRPDAHVWAGRRALAAIDAVAFPALWILAIAKAPFDTGSVGPVLVAAAILVATERLTRAIWRNERYRFATWVWGKQVAGVLFIGAVLKFATLVV